MKQFILLFLLSIFLLGCSKEKRTNKILHGKWTVDRTTTRWTNANSSSPSYSHQDNYATIEFDKKGKGKMIVPAGVEYWNGYEIPYDEEVYELEAGVESVQFFYLTYDPENFKLTWKWDKKSFVLSNGDIHYNENTSSYSEVKFTCEKAD